MESDRNGFNFNRQMLNEETHIFLTICFQGRLKETLSSIFSNVLKIQGAFYHYNEHS